jgi:hypothetical protein
MAGMNDMFAAALASLAEAGRKAANLRGLRKLSDGSMGYPPLFPRELVEASVKEGEAILRALPEDHPRRAEAADEHNRRIAARVRYQAARERLEAGEAPAKEAL